MQSFDLPLIISNAHEHTSADLGHITPSEVHRVTLTKMFWIPRNMYVLINDAMRQRLNLGFDETSPPHTFGSWIDSILISRGPYRTCENVYFSLDPIAYRLKSIAYPLCVPDLLVDFVLGTVFFNDLNLEWTSELNRLITRSEEGEEARRHTYRNIL
jgi:hypothetical protein